MNSELRATIDATVRLELSEAEARALRAITVYGAASFLCFFYDNLGRGYLEPHEKGLCSLFDSISIIERQLKSVDAAKSALKEAP